MTSYKEPIRYVTVIKLPNRGLKSKPWYVGVYHEGSIFGPQYIMNYEGFKTKREAVAEAQRHVDRLPSLYWGY